jgi:hypothetical protein
MTGVEGTRDPGKHEVVPQTMCCGTIEFMKAVVQARLDPEAQQALDGLVRRLGWSPSKVVRESLRLMSRHHGPGPRRKVIGTGKFASRLTDLGSNKRHLEGFGR